MTRGAMYHHFASKEDLFRAVYEEIEGELSEQIADAALAAAPTRWSSCAAGVLAFLDAAATPDVRRICLLDAPSVLPAEVRRELAERYGLGLVRESLARADGRRRRSPSSRSSRSRTCCSPRCTRRRRSSPTAHDRAEVDAVVDGSWTVL